MAHCNALAGHTPTSVVASRLDPDRDLAGRQVHRFAHVKRHTVGRQKELAELGRAFESAAAGRGLIVCVTGEPGLGKTTLVEELPRRAGGQRPAPCRSPGDAVPSAWPAPRPTCRFWRRWTACSRAPEARRRPR